MPKFENKNKLSFLKRKQVNPTKSISAKITTLFKSKPTHSHSIVRMEFV